MENHFHFSPYLQTIALDVQWHFLPTNMSSVFLRFSRGSKYKHKHHQIKRGIKELF